MGIDGTAVQLLVHYNLADKLAGFHQASQSFIDFLGALRDPHLNITLVLGAILLGLGINRAAQVWAGGALERNPSVWGTLGLGF